MALGDVIMTEPILRYFKERGEEVNIITRYPFVFENAPWSVNLDIPVAHNLNTAYETNRYKLAIDAYFERCGIYPEGVAREDKKPRLYIPEVNTGISEKYIIMHFTTCPTGKYRNLYTNYQVIFDFLSKKNIKYILIEPNKYDFKFMCSLIKNASCFIGLDSSPAHVAQVYNIPSLIFMGNVNPEYRYFGDNQIFMSGECESQYCYHTFEVHPPMGICCDKEINSVPKCAYIHEDLIIANVEKLLERI